MKGLIKPMLAAAGELPTAEGDWAYEMKWDGVRAVVHIEGGRVQIMARSGRDISVSYPELQALGAEIDSAVLDGEIVAFNGDGRPDFAVLQQRMHVANTAQAVQLSAMVPAVFLAFDLLRIGEASLLDHPYSERRELMDRLALDGPNWHTPPAFFGDGAGAWETSRAAGLEGIVAKRVSSPYRPGVRTRDWIKIKHLTMQEGVIGGWRPGQGRRAGLIGSLLLGIPSADGLRYIGHVGTGFTDVALVALTDQLRQLACEHSPFVQPLPRLHAQDAHWVRPLLVGEAAFSEWTPDDLMRHPVWRGLRPDKTPADVIVES